MSFSWRSDRPFLLLFAALVAARAALLVVSQHSVCGDEATVGITAIHVIEKGERPVFAWHEHYNGGAAVTAYLATVTFRLFGPSEIALKLVPLAFSLLALVVVYLFVRGARGPRPAFFAALLCGTAVDLLKWNFDARGGYAECQALIPLCLWLLASRCLGDAPRPAAHLLLGVLCGLGVYLLGLFIPVVVTVGVFLLVHAWVKRRWTGGAAWVAGIVVGAAPLLVFHAQGGPVGLEVAPAAARIGVAPAVLARTFTRDLPSLLTYANLEGIPRIRLAPNGIEYSAIVLSIAALVFRRRNELAAWWRNLRARQAGPVSFEALLLAYVAVFLFLYSVHPLAGEDARHLIFLEPQLSILAGLGFAETLAPGRPRALAGAAALLLAVALTDRAAQHVALSKDDGVYGPLGRSDPRDAEVVAAFLEARGVRHVMTEDWDLSWRMVFRSHERIEATHSVLWLNRLLHENDFQRTPYAVILAPGAPHEDRTRQLLARHHVGERYSLAGRTLYLLVGRPPVP